MKKFSLSLLFTLALAGIGLNSMAQTKVAVRFFENVRGESAASYGFFTGPDAADFTTSVKGFGSGLLDAFAMRNSIEVISIGTDRLYLSAGVGFAVNKYRLEKNLVFGQTEDNVLTWRVDPDTTHNYVNTFFGYGKSKIITTSFYFPLDVTVAIGKNVIVSAGGYMDLNLSARYKMKYLVGDEKVKEIIRSADFRDFNPSTTKFGVSLSLYHKKADMGIAASYSLTPFFVEGLGPDIHEARISATYMIKNRKSLMKKQEEEE